MNTELRKKAKNDFEKNSFKLMNNAVFGKTMENVRNHRDIKLVTNDKRRSILASEPNYYWSKRISKDLMIMEKRKAKVKMNKPIYLGRAILDISKILMYEFWYGYIKPKYRDNTKLCYMDTDELGMKIMKEFCALRAKAYSYRFDDDTEMKKAKGTKKCIVKRELTFKYYMDCLFNNEVIIKLQQRFRCNHHRVYTEEVNKIALSSNDDKRLQTFNKVTTFPYGTNVFKMCESEMLSKKKNGVLIKLY